MPVASEFHAIAPRPCPGRTGQRDGDGVEERLSWNKAPPPTALRSPPPQRTAHGGVRAARGREHGGALTVDGSREIVAPGRAGAAMSAGQVRRSLLPKCAAMKPGHEDDDFRQTWAPEMFSEKAHERACAEVEGILALAQPAAGAAINVFISFGYFEDQDEDRQVARNLFASLKPGGALLMEMMGKEVLARIFQPRRWHRLDDGAIRLDETEVTRGWTWGRTRWMLIRDGECTEHVVEHRIYSAAELTALLAEAGFESSEVHAQLSGTPYDHEAPRLVVLARKPEE